MDLDTLDKTIDIVLRNLSNKTSGSFDRNDALSYEVLNVFNIASLVLKEHKTFFNSMSTAISNRINFGYPFSVSEAISALNHIKQIIKLERDSEEKVKEIKIFEGANEKLKQAGLSFSVGDYSSTFNNLNTALELALKDKLCIPITITGINTSNIIEILIKYKVEPHLYLAEAKKHIVLIDNKIKHQGYSPTKVDCINAIGAMEGLMARLKGEIVLIDEVKQKIYEGL